MENKKIALPILGLDLLSSETRMQEGAVRIADNVDITSEGVFNRRGGSTLAIATSDAHSMHKTPRGILVAVDETLNALVGGSLQPVCPLGGSGLVDFTEYNGHTYFTNGAICAWIPSDASSARRVGASLPAALPVLSAGPGSLLAGTYSVGLSRVDDRGEESGMRIIGQVDLPNGGGIALSGLQLDLSCTYRAYLTTADGDALYLSEEFSGAFTQFVLSRQPDGTAPMSWHLSPMPAGDFIRGHAGRLYVADDDTLYYSEALRPHLTDPRHNFIKFSGRIKFVEAVSDGLYVGDTRGVWFLSGTDPEQFKPKIVSAAVAMRRSSLLLPAAHFDPKVAGDDGNVALWLSTEGYVIGRPGGQATSLHPDRIRVAADLEGRSRFVVRNGNKQIITLVSATTATGYGVSLQTQLQ